MRVRIRERRLERFKRNEHGDQPTEVFGITRGRERANSCGTDAEASVNAGGRHGTIQFCPAALGAGAGGKPRHGAPEVVQVDGL
jgi:hypothetical protein